MDAPQVNGFAFAPDRALDLICLGRAGVDLYAQQEGTPLDRVSTFRKSVGGSPANVATGAARLGLRVAMIGVVADDGFGRYVRQFLADNAVGVDSVKTDTTGSLNSVAFTEMRPDDCKVIIYRRSAADLQLSVADIDRDLIANARALFVTGTALSASPSREATVHAMRLACQADTTVVLDLDYRPYGWTDGAEASAVLGAACALADIVIGNREEFDVLQGLQLTGSREPEVGAQALLSGVTRAVVVKDGPRGCRVFLRGGTVIEQGIFAVRSRKPFGSGDAFAAALLWALIEGRSWPEAARWGAAGAAINVSGDACAESMATRSQLLAFVEQHAPPRPDPRPETPSPNLASMERSR
jgi:5-dehydro-2-deoxygluconokinase